MAPAALASRGHSQGVPGLAAAGLQPANYRVRSGAHRNRWAPPFFLGLAEFKEGDDHPHSEPAARRSVAEGDRSSILSCDGALRVSRVSTHRLLRIAPTVSAAFPFHLRRRRAPRVPLDGVCDQRRHGCPSGGAPAGAGTSERAGAGHRSAAGGLVGRRRMSGDGIWGARSRRVTAGITGWRLSTARIPSGGMLAPGGRQSPIPRPYRPFFRLLEPDFRDLSRAFASNPGTPGGLGNIGNLRWFTDVFRPASLLAQFFKDRTLVSRCGFTR